jgi:hypothetical protein
VWWDPALQSGQDYQDAIDTSLRSALVVVVLWSPLSVKSRWVRSEATVGDRRGALMPVMVRPCDRPVAFELVQTTDLTHWRGDRKAPEWSRFVSDLQTKIAALRAQAASKDLPAPLEPSDLEALFWSSIKDSTDASDFKSYLNRYPTGHFIDLARGRLVANGKLMGHSPHRARVTIISTAAVVVVGASIVLWFAFLWPRRELGERPVEQQSASARATAPSTSTSTSTPVPAVATDKVIEIWFAGSPHQSGQPSTEVSQRIIDTARSLGYSVKARGFEATDFFPELVKSVAAGNPPDIIFTDNFMHVRGGTTQLGSFKGMESDPGLSSRLMRVNEALSAR